MVIQLEATRNSHLLGYSLYTLRPCRSDSLQGHPFITAPSKGDVLIPYVPVPDIIIAGGTTCVNHWIDELGTLDT